MIIRINKTRSVADPSGPPLYGAFLVTDAGEVNIASLHPSFSYVLAVAGRFRELLSAKTPENIRIDYPEGAGSTFDTPTTARIRSKNKLPFDSAGTLEGIKLQARNVAERASLLDYADFVVRMKTLVAELEDDFATRNKEEEAKVVEMNRENSLKPRLSATEIDVIRHWRSVSDPFLAKAGTQFLMKIIDRLAGDELQ